MRSNFKLSSLLILSLLLLANTSCYKAQPIVERVDDANSEQATSKTASETSDETAVREKIEKLSRNLSTENAGEHTAFEQTRLMVSGPQGATVNKKLGGFDDEERDYTIRLSVVPMPFNMDFRNEIVSKLGSYAIAPLYTRDVNIDGIQGGYYFGTESIPSDDDSEEQQTILKHMICFGDDTYTWVVAASFPESQEEELSQLLLDSVMSTKINSEDFPEIRGNEFGFSIIKPPGLKFCKGWGEKYVLTSSGEFPVKSIEECFAKFEELPLLEPLEKDNRLNYTKSLLKAAPTITVNKISLEQKITVDDLPGYEVIGVGREDLSQTPIFLFSAVLFDEKSVYTFSSWYGMRNESMDQLDDLKTLLRSFRRTKK